MVSCPKCGSAKLRRSPARGFYEEFLKNFSLRSYRCKDCGWRGRLKEKRQTIGKTSNWKDVSIPKLVFLGALLLVTVYLAIFIVKRLG